MNMKTFCSIIIAAVMLLAPVVQASAATGSSENSAAVLPGNAGQQPPIMQRGRPPGPPPGPPRGPQQGEISFEDKAKELGVDITGLSDAEARIKVEAAELERLQADAKKVGVDITGLSLEDAKEKLADAIQQQSPDGTNGKVLPEPGQKGDYASGPIKPGDKFRPAKNAKPGANVSAEKQSKPDKKDKKDKSSKSGKGGKSGKSGGGK